MRGLKMPPDHSTWALALAKAAHTQSSYLNTEYYLISAKDLVNPIFRKYLVSTNAWLACFLQSVGS